MNKNIKIFLLGVLSIGIIFVMVTTITESQKNKKHSTRGGVSINTGKDGKGRGFTNKELIAANLALDSGIRIEDPESD
jgi:hypothetical protein